MGFLFFVDYATKKINVYDTGGGDVIDGYEYVDLGLPSYLLWATCNIGASSPEEYGEYYTWGGNTNKSKSDYYAENTDLPITRDTARNKMGGSWRMPTSNEFNELVDNCNRIWTTQNGVKGYLLTSKINSQTIFFPAAGYYYSGMSRVGSQGNYWSSSWFISGYVRMLIFNSSDFNTSGEGNITGANSVRGVIEKPIEYTYVDLGLSVYWATCNVGARKPEELGLFFKWGSTEGVINTSSNLSNDFKNLTEFGQSTELPLSNDSANIYMGGNWRMPTRDECQELINNCDASTVYIEGVKMEKFTSKNNPEKYILFPCSGYVDSGVFMKTITYFYCWSKTPTYAIHGGAGNSLQSSNKNAGFNVRGVIPKSN